VVLSLEAITEKSQQIATAAAEQTEVSDDISQRINMIEHSGSELRGVVDETKRATQTLNQLSEDLSSKVARFEVA
jgi:methyl-accepting chemotaxis protein